MSAVRDRIKAHAQPEAVRRLEVPEWGEGEGKPLVICYRLVTLDDLALVHQLDGAEWHKQAARIVALKALSESGERLFQTIDAVWLREEAAPDVVNRIAIAMLGRMTVEAAAKN